MEKNFKYKFFHLIFEFFLILNKRNFSNCSCGKDIPILKQGQCQSVYCTQEEFNNKVCTIDNEIIKTQWLNNFIDFKECKYRFTNMVINNEGDLILETSPEETSGERLFLRLKKNGEFFFKDNDDKEIVSKKIVVLDEDKDDGAMRYESQVFLIKINNSEFDENKQYLVSISLYFGFLEIYDLDDNNIPFSKLSYLFHKYVIYSRKGSIIELNNKEYLYFFIGSENNNGLYKLVIEKYSFNHNNITQENFHLEYMKDFQIQYSRIVNAYKIESNQIILFYINNCNKFKAEILNEGLEVENETYFGNPQNYNYDDSIFFKSIHLKENICIFAYYTNEQIKYPKVLLINITDNQFIYMFDIFLKEHINTYESNTDPLLNDLVKINDKRFSLISSSQNRLSLYITLFDLYNNYQNIKIRFYKIDIFNLYKYKIFKELSGILFNNYLTVSISTCNSNQCEDTKIDQFFTSLLIFSYVNGSNYNLNITSYFSKQENNDKDNDDIYLNFPNEFKIENNIFGYQIMKKIKIISIPEEIDLYYIDNDNKTLINIGDEYNQIKTILISPKKNITKNSSIYYIEYQYQYSDPDYDTFNKYPDIISDYDKNSSIDQEDEFNNDIQYYYGKTLKIEFKLCNDYCKTCKLIGKSEHETKCEECKDNLKAYLDEESNTMTCFSEEKDCPEDFPFLSSENNNNCIKKCDYQDMLNDKCILDNSSNESLQKVYILFSDIISNDYNNEEVVFKTDKDLTFQLSNSENEKSYLNGTKKYNNLSIIDLGECETKLKSANNIPEEESLIIFKIENYYQNTTIKNIQYEIYDPITRNKIEDLSPCQDETIDIYVPTNLDNNTLTMYEEMKNQGYDIFNANDSFYNDICTKYSTENNTDLTLNDRKDLFYNQSQIFCQENCAYQYINVEMEIAKCECSVSENTEIEIEYEKKSPLIGNEIIASFFDTIKYSNFLILKCYELVFSSAGIKNNMGSIVLIISMCFILIFTVIFLFTGMNKIKDQMSKMVFCSINKVNVLSISIYEPHSEDFNSLKKAIFPPAPGKKKKKKKRKIKIKEENPIKKLANFNYSKTFKFSHKGAKKKKSKLKNGDKNAETIRKNSSMWGLNRSKAKGSVVQGMKKYKNSSPMVFIHKAKNNKKSIVGITQKYSEYELDDLDYLEALKYDKRTFFEFFLCLVKREHLIVFTFIFCSDLNLLVIKLALFVFSVSLDFTTNVLFFTDDTMHKIYLDYGKYNFISQIPQIIYSTVISEIFDVFLKYLSLSEKEIYDCKNFKNKKQAVEEVRKLIKKIKIKFFCFFGVCIIFISFFWYFITAFCAVYKNTQVILFKDSAVSLLISLLYPFGLYLIPAALRIMALRSTKKDKRCLYKISNIFPLF